MEKAKRVIGAICHFGFYFMLGVLTHRLIMALFFDYSWTVVLAVMAVDIIFLLGYIAFDME